MFFSTSNRARGEIELEKLEIANGYREKLAAVNEELSLMVRIAMELVGQPAGAQKYVGKYYQRFAHQDKFPNVRDFVRALLESAS
jgi:hypothetical protein